MLQQSNVQRQQLRILPQQIQLLNLFHLNTLELSQKIKEELEENPCLEETPKELENDETENITTSKTKMITRIGKIIYMMILQMHEQVILITSIKKSILKNLLFKEILFRKCLKINTGSCFQQKMN